MIISHPLNRSRLGVLGKKGESQQEHDRIQQIFKVLFRQSRLFPRREIQGLSDIVLNKIALGAQPIEAKENPGNAASDALALPG